MEFMLPKLKSWVMIGSERIWWIKK
jgi:hypothetical protein